MVSAENALVIFAPVPRPGSVKSGLMPAFTPEEANEIHVAILGDVVERAARALSGRAAVSLAWSEPVEANETGIGPLPEGVSVEVQSGGDPGERMALAIQSRLRAGHRRVAILGSDAPTLPDDHLTAAFDALRRAEVVIGPNERGGYYLIGMSHLHLEIFRNVPWGTRDVLPVTKKRLKHSGTPFEVLGAWRDVETPEDAARLWKELIRMQGRHAAEIPQRTHHVLARLAPGRLHT